MSRSVSSAYSEIVDASHTATIIIVRIKTVSSLISSRSASFWKELVDQSTCFRCTSMAARPDATERYLHYCLVNICCIHQHGRHVVLRPFHDSPGSNLISFLPMRVTQHEYCDEIRHRRDGALFVLLFGSYLLHPSARPPRSTTAII